MATEDLLKKQIMKLRRDLDSALRREAALKAENKRLRASINATYAAQNG